MELTEQAIGGSVHGGGFGSRRCRWGKALPVVAKVATLHTSPPDAGTHAVIEHRNAIRFSVVLILLTTDRNRRPTVLSQSGAAQH